MTQKQNKPLSYIEKLNIIKLCVERSGGKIHKMDDEFLYVIINENSILNNTEKLQELKEIVQLGIDLKLKIKKI